MAQTMSSGDSPRSSQRRTKPKYARLRRRLKSVERREQTIVPALAGFFVQVTHRGLDGSSVVFPYRPTDQLLRQRGGGLVAGRQRRQAGGGAAQRQIAELLEQISAAIDQRFAVRHERLAATVHSQLPPARKSAGTFANLRLSST